ncbi:MAG: hypothetical protein AAFY28_22890, partial [Actinomycetota bacterium]
SPFPPGIPKDPQEVIRPAVDGTLRALNAAREAGIPQAVVTSSVAAVCYGRGGRETPFTEDDWTDPDGDDVAVSLVTFLDEEGNDRSAEVTLDDSTPGELLIQWTPTTDGTISVAVRAVDTAGAGQTQTFDLSVLDNAPPVVGDPQFPSASVGTPYGHDFAITDPNPGDTLS